MRRSRPFGVALAGMVMAFLAVVAMSGPETASPEARLPERYRLADLIERQQEATAELRREVEALRAEVDEARAAGADRSASVGLRQIRVGELSDVAGIAEMKGPGLKVTLDDSDLRSPPDGANVNDLVIHSQDVQAVVNALWRSGAEAISINGQRLVSTSAVLCVGNTLLLNGTVHSPPYVVTAIGATRDRFDNDRLIKRLKQASTAFGIRVEVEKGNELTVPAYRGSTKLTYARPVS
ncbi:MAG TPA: DUF881 domain-containing protein [Acidimicrobiales bacterium]|nr:DUF881 domain-containing protein [Acidimicrobiales bacterium]